QGSIKSIHTDRAVGTTILSLHIIYPELHSVLLQALPSARFHFAKGEIDRSFPTKNGTKKAQRALIIDFVVTRIFFCKRQNP
ncbi:hypothetical protein, partial [Algoriphagus ratkowskyi]|uniref:hypothetical protein n=1 Tax=Algoriphagus ratkowskyi TaxID=57028 RepID=UPI00196B5CBB